MAEQQPVQGRSQEVWKLALLVFLFFLLCYTRLYNLGWKTLMHDETLFMYYTHDQLFKSWTYVYLPILHGPASLHIQSIMFHLFGASTFTLRLGCALAGIGGFFWIYMMRHWLGEFGTFAALIFYIISPGVSFFQRFFHMDALYIFCTLWILASFAYWWRFRSPAWLASALIGCTTLFTNKESSLFLYFSLVTFFIVFAIHDVVGGLLQGRSALRCDLARQDLPRFPNAVWPAGILFVFIILCLTMIFEGMIYDADVVKAIGHDWVLKNIRSIPILLGWTSATAQTAPDAGGMIDRGFWLLFYAGMFVGLFFVFSLMRFAVNHRLGSTLALAGFWERAHAARWHIIGALALSTVLYLTMFNTFFLHKLGFFEIYEKTWSYWGGQHEWGRIGGPFHQHPLHMLIYELPAVLIVATAWLLGMFRLVPSRVLGIAFILLLLPIGAFHKLIFSGLEFMAPGNGGLVEMNILFLKNLFFASFGVAVALVLLPRSARLLVPLSFFGLVVYSIRYFTGDFWNNRLRIPLYKDGAAVELTGRHVDLFQYMEVQYNFDGGTSLAIVLVLTFFATIYTWHELSRGNRFHAFLVWWTVTSTGAACYAREAVPQVGIHAMLPLCILACSHMNRLWMRLKPGAGRTAFLLALGLMILWNTKQHNMLNYYYPDDPRERMVYGPTPQDLANHTDFIHEYHRIAAARVEADGVLSWIRHNNDRRFHKQVRVGISNDVVVWPCRWYLRDIEWWEDKNPERFVNENYEFIFIKPEAADRIPAIREKYHTFLGSGMRFWVPSPLSRQKLIDIWKEWIPGHYLDASPQAVPAHDAKEEWKKIWRYYIFRETFHENISGTQYIFCVRKDLY